ncbi:RIP metalloprotease RseP [Suttonella sp. R2A3]|uniref:RIP metalloprotease RseP n=1 Tax=Suttonella sp. R2A3 TaxID=2908648 RepID=UPI001F1E3618|nr:RIP metalloprotease RseP [Suttonella sp. R2A3]UJF24638.1 RIP metalloprotease RseP [Suttonella sp. R2A3]
MTVFFGILGFIITIGLLVVIHEYGHFWVARRFDVKILRFSLGFGKPLLSWRGKRDGTLYTLAPIPLGGFVQMYDEEDDKSVNEADRHRTFASKAPWQRFLIAFAGPAVNLIFAVLAFAALFMVGVDGIRPQVAHIAENTLAAESGLQTGDVLTAIDGKTVKLGIDAHVALVGAPRELVTLEYLGAEGQPGQATLDLSSLRAGDELDMANATGLYLVDEWFPATVGEVVENSPADVIGLQAGDQIISINDDGPMDLLSAHRWIGAHPDADVRLVILHNGQSQTLSGQLGQQTQDGDAVGFLGIRWLSPDFSEYRTTERYGFVSALGKGVDKTLYYTQLTFNMFARLIKGQVSIDNIGGPLTIGDAAGKTLQYGWDVFLNFLGIVSLSLAAINLLPIPMLDGGHMLLSAIEMVRGKPLSERAMTWVMNVGKFVVLGFMAFVIINDFHRYLF